MILKEHELSELGEMIRQIIREERANAPIPQPEPERVLIRRKEAQQLLGISAPTIIEYEKKGYIRPLRIGGTVRYDKAEILKGKKQ